jgi:Stage II sporulation protein E (SpoIIE)
VNQPISELCEWYIFEGLPTSSAEPHGETERAVRLGPFATENECRILLESMQQMPRFSGSALEVHKKSKRREKRTEARLPVYLRRSATGQKPQFAHTVDIANSGARLADLREPLSLGEIIEVDCDRRNAVFRVVWIGSPGRATQGQAGITCLTPETNIWGLHLSQQMDDEPLPQEIAVARAVQTRLLPQEFPPLQTLEYRGHCIQSRTVGGDYYDFLDMGLGRVGFVLADVAGKGIAAALLMANLQASLRSHATMGSKDLAQVLASVNHHFYKHTETHSYATLFFGCYDDATQKLRYVNCGHNPPLLLRKDGVERMTATATVIGLFRDWECSVAEAHLESGDILCIYSDGITEATGENGKEFGETRLLELLWQSRSLDAASIVQKVEQGVEQFRSGEQEDDLTMVIVRACGKGGKPVN